MLRTKQCLVLTALAAVEIARRPLCLLLTGSCVALTGLTPLALMHSFGEDGKLARDSGLAFHFVLGLFVAGYAACFSLSNEIRKGTASTVLSKPVDRETFFLAKFLGIAAVVVAFSLCAVCATLMAERVAEKFCYTQELIGYFTDEQTGKLLIAAPLVACLVAAFISGRTGRSFQSTAFVSLIASLLLAFCVSGFFDRTGNFAPYDLGVEWRILPAGMLIAMALILLSAIALTLSARLGTAPTLALCGAIFLAGLMSDFLFGRHASHSWPAFVLYYLIPNLQHFWVPDALIGGGVIPWGYVLRAGFYAAAYTAGVLCIGMLFFRRAELK